MGFLEIKEVGPAGAVPHAGDFERLAGFGEECLGQESQIPRRFAVHERLVGKFDGQANLLGRKAGFGGPLRGLGGGDFGGDFVPPDGERDSQRGTPQDWGRFTSASTPTL